MVTKITFSCRALRIHPPQKRKSSKREPTWVVVGVSNSYKLSNKIFSLFLNL